VRTVAATRYVTPLREGGSLPAIVEGDDDGLYVAKFRGAGQGAKALVAEVVSGEVGRAAGLRVPELVRLEVDLALGRNEPDPEIRALLKASAGTNLGVDFLPGSVAFDPVVGPAPDRAIASSVVAFDALVANVDRTARNTNLLVWHQELWLIDHGATLGFHHAWDLARDPARSPFAAVKDHVLLPWASDLAPAVERLRARLDRATLERAAADVPDGWLGGEPPFLEPAAHRAAYVDHLARRLEAADLWLAEAERARARVV
jgi:hypothetical protein